MIRGVARILGFCLAAHGCALSPGEGFAHLEPGALRVELEIGAARELSEHLLLTDRGYRVALASCRLRLEDFELQTLDASGGGNHARFDPADPPAGYGPCHGGHCHADDGSLVSYDEVQARLAGGSATWKPVARVSLATSVDLLQPTRKALSRYEPLADLPEVVIGRAVVRIADFRCEGSVEGNELPEPLALDATLPLKAASISTPLDQGISRDGPETLAPDARLRIDGTLFDGLDFASLADDARVSLDGDDAAALESFASAAALTVQLRTGED